MLIQFNFRNYRSFKDEAILDLSATKMTEFSDRVVSVGGEKILPIAAIYGANASGKSNVYSAFVFMHKYVEQSFMYGDEQESYMKLKPAPFLFSDEAEHADTGFEVYFTVPGDKREKIYNYGFCIGKDGITEEWLNYKSKTSQIFKRIFLRATATKTLDLQGLPQTSRSNIEIALEKQVLIVSLGAKLKDEKCKLVRDWFVRNKYTDFGDIITGIRMHGALPKGFVNDPLVRGDVVKYFSTFDGAVKDFQVEEISDENGEKRYKVSTIHRMIDSDRDAQLPLRDESAGTLKMLALYPYLRDVFKNGGVYFIDELNARLHPLLVRNIILTFLNPEINTQHAQLIFTIHDTWHLSNLLLRRDEIWFTEKDDHGVSSLYSLADFVDDEGAKIRKDESYEKNYLLGKYGAIPFLNTISFSREE